MLSPYLSDIVILLLVATLVVPIAKIARLGVVPGFAIAGALAGPSGLGLINNIHGISNLGEIGVVLLLFVIGMEITPARLWQLRHLVLYLGSLQIVVTGLLLCTLVLFFFVPNLKVAILIGAALALSSTAFVSQLLTEKRLLSSDLGKTSIAVLLMQDLAVVPLLALVPLLSRSELPVVADIALALIEAALMFCGVILLGRYCFHPLLGWVVRAGAPELFTALTVLIVLGCAVALEHVGLSMAMGAFLAGMLIADSAYKPRIMREIQPFRGLLLGLFFMCMGMSLDLNYFFSSPWRALSQALLLIVLKAVVLTLLAVVFRQGLRNSLAVGLLLSQGGEFALILFSLAQNSGLLSAELLNHLLLVVLLSMMATPMLLAVAKAIKNAPA